MKIILSNSMTRRVLLFTCLANTFRTIPISYLAEKFHTSKQTIISDLDYLQSNWPHIIRLEVLSGEGIRLIEEDSSSILEVYQDILKDSQEYQLLEGMFLEPEHTGRYWETKLFLSTSTLYRITRRITSALREQDIFLTTKPYQLNSTNEVALRYFFRTYFYECYGSGEWPFDFDKDEIIHLLRQVSADFELNLNEVQLTKYSYLIAVSLIRISQGYYSKKKQVTNLNSLPFLAYMTPIHTLTQNYQFDDQKLWIEDFLSMLFWWKEPWKDEKQATLVRQAGMEFIQRLSDDVTISIDNSSNKKIQQSFVESWLKAQLYPYPRYILYNRYTFLIRPLKLRYNHFYQRMEETFSNTLIQYELDWLDTTKEEFYFYVFMLWKNLINELESRSHYMSFGILTDLGYEHGEFLCSVLRHYLPVTAKFTNMGSEYLLLPKSTPIPPFDIYISNYVLPNTPLEKQYIIADIPTEKNIHDLQKIVT
ncbi:helix-turn-helix domain-containing protein [Enterococcus sp. HY326]|uniref:helix-turn-helix domain-containing protein n=1 Tax=Enterococcus sp. HY326 TaxID=2971265 RepID=UPI00223FB184|nr:helix-turn-helix domain-containing protein [Enterococcus sp. HY326]